MAKTTTVKIVGSTQILGNKKGKYIFVASVVSETSDGHKSASSYYIQADKELEAALTIRDHLADEPGEFELSDETYIDSFETEFKVDSLEKFATVL